MAHAHAAVHRIENPGSLKSTGTLTSVFGAFIVIGLIAFFATYSGDQQRAWTCLLRSHFFFMGISVGALFFVAMSWITTSMWTATIRRVAESFTAYLPIAIVSTVLVFLGAHSLYSWTNPSLVHGDPIIEGKSGYLNLTFFYIRAGVGLLGWLFFAKKLVGASLSSDQGGDFKKVYGMSRKVGIGFIAFFAISFSAMAFDQLMSLDPHFFSTMFGVYCFAGAYQAFFSMLAIVVIILRRTGYLKGIVNENHVHDIGKWMFAFTIFWAYTGFSQYMLIWYANLPEETGYFMLRFNHGWENISIALFIGRFFLPFFLLLPRGNKRCEELVFLVAIWCLFMHGFDLNWIIQPEFYPDGPRVGLPEVGVWLGFLGAFGLVVTRFLKKNNVVSIKDPMLPDAVNYHHI